jgi:transcriptional regulator with XRE-family HTH domain
VKEMNIKNFNSVPEFLDVFMNERKISQTDLAESLNYTTSYINQILSGKKPASEGFFKTFSEAFTEFEYEDCLELLERDKEKRTIGESQGHHSLAADPKSTTTGRSLEETPNIEEKLKLLSGNPNTLELLQLLESNPHVQSLIRKLANHSEDILADIEEQVDNFLESTISNLIPKYTHKELKDLLLKAQSSWIKQGKTPGYDLSEDNLKDGISIEGHLHLSNSALFFTLEVTNKYLSITTRYQDRTHMEEFIKLVPGWVHRESKTGNLGRVYKNVPLQIVRIINLSPMALMVKSILATLGAPSQNITIESCSIESYFK